MFKNVIVNPRAIKAIASYLWGCSLVSDIEHYC